ncbi:isocitrate/isopropylmalate family dehydrogenase, partial [Mycobacterium sp. NPDC003449]
VANPIGQIWSASMMLEHLGEPDAAAAIMTAVEDVLAAGGDALTPDIGGPGNTATLGAAIRDRLESNTTG